MLTGWLLGLEWDWGVTAGGQKLSIWCSEDALKLDSGE